MNPSMTEKTPPQNPYATREVTARFLNCDLEIIERIAAEKNMTLDDVLTMAIFTYDDAEKYRRETGALLPWEQNRKAVGLGTFD